MQASHFTQQVDDVVYKALVNSLPEDGRSKIMKQLAGCQDLADNVVKELSNRVIEQLGFDPGLSSCSDVKLHGLCTNSHVAQGCRVTCESPCHKPEEKKLLNLVDKGFPPIPQPSPGPRPPPPPPWTSGTIGLSMNNVCFGTSSGTRSNGDIIRAYACNNGKVVDFQWKTGGGFIVQGITNGHRGFLMAAHNSNVCLSVGHGSTVGQRAQFSQCDKDDSNQQWEHDWNRNGWGQMKNVGQSKCLYYRTLHGTYLGLDICDADGGHASMTFDLSRLGGGIKPTRWTKWQTVSPVSDHYPSTNPDPTDYSSDTSGNVQSKEQVDHPCWLATLSHK